MLHRNNKLKFYNQSAYFKHFLERNITKLKEGLSKQYAYQWLSF